MTKTFVIGVLAVRMALPLPFVGGVETTEASMLTKIQALLTGQQASAAEITDNSGLNSQAMPLLEAPANPNAKASTSLTIAEGTALLSPTPMNTSPILPAATATPASKASSNTITSYTVQKGDTVSSIAKQYGISINTVLWANNLRKDSTLALGKKLVILPISGVTYTVKSGDTLLSVSKKYNGDVQEIMAYNNMATDSIKSGDLIVIPDGEAPDTTPVKAASPSTASSIVKKVANAALGVNIASAQSSDEDVSGKSPIVNTISGGYYMRPISAGVRTQGIHGDNAVDLADSCGTPIYASAAGVITISKDDGAWNGGYGSYVVISHNNASQTLYGHMSKIFITEGTSVTQGQEIGLIGNTGKVNGATGCHVHFEIRNGPVNPF